MPSVYIKKGQTPEGKARRLRAFRHNSYSGHARMIMAQARGMSRSDTLTPEAQRTAAEIEALAIILLNELRTRVD